MFCGSDLAILAILITKKNHTSEEVVSLPYRQMVDSYVDLRGVEIPATYCVFFWSQLLTVSKGTSTSFSWTEALTLSHTMHNPNHWRPTTPKTMAPTRNHDRRQRNRRQQQAAAAGIAEPFGTDVCGVVWAWRRRFPGCRVSRRQRKSLRRCCCTVWYVFVAYCYLSIGFTIFLWCKKKIAVVGAAHHESNR